MKLYFVRHGESEANRLREFSNRGLRHGLTETGKQQARALAQTLQAVPVAAIFSSPLLRARQTAEILAQAHGLAYEATDALREYDCGILEGQSDAASWQQYWQLSEAWLSGQAWDQRLEQGESFRDIQQRFVPFVERIAQTYGPSAEAVVLVGHGGLYRCMLPLVLRNVDFRFSAAHPINHTTPIVAELTPDGLACLAWGETRLDTPTMSAV